MNLVYRPIQSQAGQSPVLSNFFSGGLVALLEALSFTPAPKPMVAAPKPMVADAGLVALPEAGIVTPPKVAVAVPVLVALPEAGAPMPMVAVAVLVALPAAGAGTGSGTGAVTGSGAGAGAGAGVAAVALDAVELDESPGDSSSLDSAGLFEQADRMMRSDRENGITSFIRSFQTGAPRSSRFNGQ